MIIYSIIHHNMLTGTSMYADSSVGLATSIDSIDEAHVPNSLLVMNDR